MGYVFLAYVSDPHSWTGLSASHHATPPRFDIEVMMICDRENRPRPTALIVNATRIVHGNGSNNFWVYQKIRATFLVKKIVEILK